MAIVKVFHGSHGGTVYFDDSYYQTLTPEQRKQNQEDLLETARQLALKIELRKLNEKKSQLLQEEEKPGCTA